MAQFVLVYSLIFNPIKIWSLELNNVSRTTFTFFNTYSEIAYGTETGEDIQYISKIPTSNLLL